ncbi:MAG: 2-C-methyl-D-erythritol 4-phosphate cytidylyltransferase [Eubacteriales bacterium]|nr:2-C-methyl-D-erythritol 4-phosphate cytidylyltransferase [Eubacteriales bacterium]MDD3867293.1 2-C-methyl-D-erythritol 4-phosphate cytidylyltransferase [Eubacteriales bacterium]MDD4461766.1 2-C-methyl-D-erythritol 4-phosphate cytidylyltransferase [Eubacteriales bacterium]
MKPADHANVFVLVPAAGSGSRMQAGINKQLLELQGRTVIEHTIDRLDRHPDVSGLILIAAEIDLTAMEAIAKRRAWPHLYRVITGGATRQHSVLSGLQALAAHPDCHDDSIVLVHDGARCLIDPLTISRVIAGIREHGVCGAALPVRDTIKKASDDGYVIETPDRSRLFAMQTPQGARFAPLLAAYQAMTAAGRILTDDLAVMEAAGHPVFLTAGNERNFKLTTRLDLQMAQWILNSGPEPSDALIKS